MKGIRLVRQRADRRRVEVAMRLRTKGDSLGGAQFDRQQRRTREMGGRRGWVINMERKKYGWWMEQGEAEGR